MCLKKICCIKIFLLFFSYLSFAQEETRLKGLVGVQGGESFNFEMVFTDSSGFLNGYSYTYLHPKQDVKAHIIGAIDKKNKTISFKETSLIYNHGFQSNATICLIRSDLKYFKDEGNVVFSGTITSSDITDVSCANGSITFQDSEALQALFYTQEKQKSVVNPPIAITPKKPLKVVYDTARKTEIIPTKLPDKITEGMEKIYEWKTDTVVMEIWDGGKIDGDRITVLYNSETVLAKYLLSKNKKRVTIPLSIRDINNIIIIANNEGNEPPNTANIILRDGDIEYPIIAYNMIGKKVEITIRKQR